MFHSISWRLQISYGLLLLGAFVALGISAYHLERTSRMATIDAGLQARATQLRGALSRPARPAPDPPGGEPTELTMPRHELRFGVNNEVPHYYLIWANGETLALLYRSDSAPDGIAPPTVSASIPESGVSRIRQEHRERILRTRQGFLILVGRDVSAELAMIRAYAAKLTLAGGALLIAGLLVSHWVARRALKPIADISEAATRIAGGAMDERIETAGNRSELGQLGDVLNHTFNELESAYRRQAQFTADASHELRTPVAVMLTEIQSAPKLSRSTEEYEEALSVCEEAATSMQQLLQQLMALAQFDAGKVINSREPIELRQLVERCIEQINPLAEERGVEMTQELGNENCTGDPDRISQVVTNLLGNAIAYNREGGKVTVTLQGDAGQAVLEVADTGIGIAPNDLPHLFQRFYRVDKSRFGEGEHSGLGLAICREIAEAHGGDITVESTLGEGSVFTLRLPV